MENSTRDRSRVFRVVHPSIHPSIHPSSRFGGSSVRPIAFRLVSPRPLKLVVVLVAKTSRHRRRRRRRRRRRHRVQNERGRPPRRAAQFATIDDRETTRRDSTRVYETRVYRKKSTNTTHARRARTHHTARTHRHRALTPERAHDTRAVSESLPPSLGPSLPRSVDGLKKYLQRYTHDCLPTHAFSIRSPAKASTRTEKGQNRGSDRGHVITTYSHHDGRHPIRSEPNRTAFGCFGSTILLLGTELHLYT